MTRRALPISLAVVAILQFVAPLIFPLLTMAASRCPCGLLLRLCLPYWVSTLSA